MKEKELRLALVCYGGVSLAVYMHGVTKEILKLARASSRYHAVADPQDRARLSYGDADKVFAGEPTSKRETDTETIYFDLLKMIGRELDLRVVVDVIAGASAGGVNGVILARALAHDLDIEPLRDLWLEEADVTRLLAEAHKAGPWSKWFLHPVIRAYTRHRLAHMGAAREMRAKLSTFLRSRWFRPPFDGAYLTDLLIRGLDAMGKDPSHERASLIPANQELELLVTVTDFYGYVRHIALHDPLSVREREHRHILRFAHQRWPNGRAVSDFDHAGVPALAFAGRASSSFPGAFPPAQLGEVDKVLARSGRVWLERERFVARAFAPHRLGGVDPDKTSFVDGSVLNNKPFAEAIRAIEGRPAYRDVDRRLVYIDPDPEGPPPPPDGRVPGFFATLKGALSDIPRNEPVYDDLAWIGDFNEEVRRIRTIVEATRPHVVAQVRALTREAADNGSGQDGDPLAADADVARVRYWRAAADARAAAEAGFAYDGYVRLKLAAVLSSVADRVSALCGHVSGSAPCRRVHGRLNDWARRTGVIPGDGAVPRAPVDAVLQPAWVGFLRAFDIDFRRRRLRFLVRSLNQIYPRLAEEEFDGMTPRQLDRLKVRLYDLLDELRVLEGADAIGRRARGHIETAFGGGTADAPRTADRADIEAALRALSSDIDLARLNRSVDGFLAGLATEGGEGAVRRELLVAYLGFPFWDVLTFSLTNWRDLGEFDEIRVDRISPEDADAIRQGPASATLKGIEFGHFGAFFSRGNRENDYLWGRLHGVDRLIDILCDAARLEGAAAALDSRALKKRAFAMILDAEAPHLAHCGPLIADLRREIARL